MYFQVETNSYSVSAHEKLELLQKELQQNRSDNGASGIAVDVSTASNEPNPLDHEVQPVPDGLGTPYTEDDTTSVVTEATGAVQLARIVWANRAKQYRLQRRPGVSSSSRVPAVPTDDRSSARDQFVHDVVEIINETRLYAEDTVPQQVLDKLSGIVSKAVRLQNTLPSPEIRAQQNNASPSPADGTRRNGTLRLPDSLLLRSRPIEEANSSTDRQTLRQECRQGWVKISSRQAGLQPTSCTLEITESAGGICVDIVATPRYTTPGSIEGSVQSEGISAPSTSSDRSSSGNGNLAPSRTFKHLLSPVARPIPSVWHPRYDKRYTITFTEKQVIQESGINETLWRVADLEYSFSDGEYRDHVRSLLFGKELLTSTGVTKISFHYIACERQAVSLWFDTSSRHRTITFPTSRDSTGRPYGEVEYQVLGIAKNGNAEDNDEPLVLFVGPLLDAETSERPLRRANTILSAISRRSTTSTLGADSARCSLFFSEITGKTEFWNKLKAVKRLDSCSSPEPR